MITYLVIVSMMAGPILFAFGSLAKSASAVQRLEEYCNWTEHEKSFTEPKPPSKEWPKTGNIKAEGITVRYRPGLPLVLNGVDLDIKSGEKIGVVGRTGSGKSTLLLALNRILEMATEGDKEDGKPLGSVSIDGVRIDKIGLEYLRKSMAIIPQDPFLLEGPIKFNLDPFQENSDLQIEEAIQRVGILSTFKTEDLIEQRKQEIKKSFEKPKAGGRGRGGPPKSKKSKPPTEPKKQPDMSKQVKDAIESCPIIKRLKENGATAMDIMNLKIEIGGSNLSVGQRQLICIARAIIGKPKILLMDEATANIDQKSDSLIQRVIKNDLKDATVITIAHRLITIIQYDKIVFLQNGEKIEEGPPAQLIKEGGYFSTLVGEGGERYKGQMLYAAQHHDEDPTTIVN